MAACMCMLSHFCPTLCNPMACSPPGSSVHGDSPGKNTGRLPCPPPGDLPHPGIKPTSPTLQANSLSSESPGKSSQSGSPLTLPGHLLHLTLFLLHHSASELRLCPGHIFCQSCTPGPRLIHLGHPCLALEFHLLAALPF